MGIKKKTQFENERTIEKCKSDYLDFAGDYACRVDYEQPHVNMGVGIYEAFDFTGHYYRPVFS